MSRILPSLLICCAMLSSRAAHIVGGDLYYECLGNDDYKITLKIYRDCYSFGPNVAGFDAPAYIGIYDASANLLEVVEVYLTFGPTNIPPDTRDPCLQAPASICVEEGIFEFTKNLPPVSGGYDIVYIRCCRNATIQNIFTPGAVGATYVTHIPDQSIATCNSSPYFVDFPPIVICANAPVNFDHRAVDPDGDQLVYSLCQPYDGADSVFPQPYPDVFLAPFGNVVYRSPFSVANPLGGSPPLSIHSQTGFLTGVPDRIGQYVVGVCVSEYRNGTLIGETKRDFQFNVVQCSQDVRAIVPVVDTVGAAASNTAGVFVYQCQGLFVQFINQSVNGTYYKWDFGDLTTNADSSGQFEPAYTYPDSGVYRVQLIVNPGYNCADTTAVLVKIYPTFAVDFDFVAGCANEIVTFTDRSSTTYGSIDSWAWDFGDGAVSGNQHPTHLFRDGGSYAVTLYATNTKGCSDSRTKNVTVHPMPEAAFSFTPPCLNTPVVFTDSSAIISGNVSSWIWSFDNNIINLSQNFSQTFNNLTTFNVKLIVASGFGCADTVTQTITVHPLPVAAVRTDTAICIGESVRLHASGGISYLWQPSTGLSSAADPDAIATPFFTTAYTVTVTDSNSCTDTDAVNITVNPLPATNAGNDAYMCEGAGYQLNGSGGVSFTWHPGHLVSDSAIANPNVLIADTTIFSLTSYNSFGCENHDTVTIAVQHPISLAVASAADLCEGDSVTLTAGGGIYYEWSPAGGITGNNGSDYTVFPKTNTQYTVIISNDCFADTGYVDVVIRPLPVADAGEDTTIVRDEFVTLNGTATGTNNYWEPPDGLENPNSLTTSASPFNTTTYVLTSLTEYGCKATDDVIIRVEVVNLIEIPTAFSPNNDGVNDIYRILKVLNVQQIDFFKIFNRWGQVVFETNDIRQGWDGTVYGVPQDVGVYAFIIKALNRDGEILVKDGNVTLVR